jgi:hypothetical protein
VEVIKGNIGAIPAFTGVVVFSPQRQGSKEGARGSLDERMIYPSALDPFTCRPLPIIVAEENFPVTRMR